MNLFIPIPESDFDAARRIRGTTSIMQSPYVKQITALEGMDNSST